MVKGGRGEIEDVSRYGEQIDDKSGLHLLKSQGNDLVSTTALAAAGAHVVLFTTGRGIPFGGPLPTIKIPTNNELYDKSETGLILMPADCLWKISRTSQKVFMNIG